MAHYKSEEKKFNPHEKIGLCDYREVCLNKEKDGRCYLASCGYWSPLTKSYPTDNRY
jgi:hypothetical protein